MKYVLVLGGVACAGAGAFLNYAGRENWGWFLFIAFFAFLWAAQIHYHDTGKEKK